MKHKLSKKDAIGNPIYVGSIVFYASAGRSAGGWLMEVVGETPTKVKVKYQTKYRWHDENPININNESFVVVDAVVNQTQGEKELFDRVKELEAEIKELKESS